MTSKKACLLTKEEGSLFCRPDVLTTRNCKAGMPALHSMSNTERLELDLLREQQAPTRVQTTKTLREARTA